MLDLLSPVSMKVLEILYPEERGLAKEKNWCTKSVTGVVALRSKWAAGKAVRAGLALRRIISESIRD